MAGYDYCQSRVLNSFDVMHLSQVTTASRSKLKNRPLEEIGSITPGIGSTAKDFTIR